MRLLREEESNGRLEGGRGATGRWHGHGLWKSSSTVAAHSAAMRLLREEESNGRLEEGGGGGRGGEGDRQVAWTRAMEEQFHCLQEVVRRYERILGACLNWMKSAVMMLGGRDTLDWIRKKGREIIEGSKEIRYLGVNFRVEVDEAKIAGAVIRKIENKLKH
ncbi:hypothetical protein R1flu_007144 [Riccia fluitans]|uniref:Uncharacterized protein n=1 Tax=Riccia fluitans TaxID=41844 RepID=A0ABD1YYV0_9MARC